MAPSALHPSVQARVSFWQPFPSPYRGSFNISYSAVQRMTTSLSHCVSEEGFIWPSVLRSILIGWQFAFSALPSPITLKMCSTMFSLAWFLTINLPSRSCLFIRLFLAAFMILLIVRNLDCEVLLLSFLHVSCAGLHGAFWI